MREFTLDDLRRIMRNCAGVDESVDLDGDILDSTFSELGYDSLAVLELMSQVQQEYGVAIPDDALEYMKTPREAIRHINERFTTVG